MGLGQNKYIRGILFTSIALSFLDLRAASPSTWTGAVSDAMFEDFNWDNGSPSGGLAIFNGEADNPPFTRQAGLLSYDEIEFTAGTSVSVITQLETSGASGVVIHPGVSANFDIYEQQYPIFDPARLQITNGPVGDGGGSVNYNLEGYGQLYAFSGSTGETIVNVIMTNGNNYFEIDSSGVNLFDNVSSDATSDEIALFSNANLTIRGSNANSIHGVISGSGSVTKTGPGTLELNNDNTYDGETNVDAGILKLNGSVSADLIVALGATLQGTGLIGGDLVTSGVVAPGNPDGALVAVSFLPTDSNVFDCEVTSEGSSDVILATQSAAVAGSLYVIPLDLSFTSPQTYTIINTGILLPGYSSPLENRVTGTFSSIKSSVPALMLVNYGSNDVLLTYLPISAIGLHKNALAAGNCFAGLSSKDAQGITQKLTLLTFPEMQEAFNQMQPSQFSALTWTQMQNALLIRSGYLKHLEGFPCDTPCLNSQSSHVWIDLMGDYLHQGSKGKQFGYNDLTGGISLGSDLCFGNFRWGGSASYTYSSVNWKEKAGNGHIDSYYGGLFGGWSDGIIYVNLSTLGAYSQYKTNRHIHFTGLDRRAHAHHNGWESLTGVEAGIYSELKHFKIGPFTRVDYVYLSQQGYSEYGAKSLNLEVNSRQDQLIQSEAGVVFTTLYTCKEGRTQGTWTPRLELSYINQTPLGKSDYNAHFAGSDCGFSVSGWSFNRNLGAVDASLMYRTAAEKVGASLRYDGQFGSRYQNQSAHFVLDIKY